MKEVLRDISATARTSTRKKFKIRDDLLEASRRTIRFCREDHSSMLNNRTDTPPMSEPIIDARANALFFKIMGLAIPAC